MNWTVPLELGGTSLDKTTAIIKVYDYMEQDRMGLSGAFTISDVSAQALWHPQAEKPVYMQTAQLHCIDIPQGEYAVKVYSLQGKNLFSWTGEGPHQIDLAKAVPSGIQMLSVRPKKGSTSLHQNAQNMRINVVMP